jgi:hypothetical protein
MDDIAEIRAEALDALSDASEWKLPADRWQAVQPVLVRMAAALESDDAAALAETTARLKLAGPRRILPIGPAAGPPPEVLTLLNRLQHTLDGVTADRLQDDAGDAGADRSRG